MSDVARIRGFLLVHPKPAFVRVTGDGESQELRVGKSYAKLAETICALDIDLVEALDKDKNILRAIRRSSPEGQRSAAAEIPAELARDPETLRLTHFANLIHRAYEHSTEVAFGRLVELCDRMNERSEAIERRLERTEAQNRAMLQDQVDDAFDRAAEAAAAGGANGESGDLMSQMAQAWMSGRASRTATTNGASTGPKNGKGH